MVCEIQIPLGDPAEGSIATSSKSKSPQWIESGCRQIGNRLLSISEGLVNKSLYNFFFIPGPAPPKAIALRITLAGRFLGLDFVVVRLRYPISLMCLKFLYAKTSSYYLIL